MPRARQQSHRIRPMIATLLLAISITSVTPSNGPVAGGTAVTIRGSGFDTTCTPDLLVCAPVAVQFGSLPAASFRIIDTQTIEAVTPSEVPGSVTVSVSMPRGAGVLANGFTFIGDAGDAFERVLLPILLPPIAGSFDSRFETSLSLGDTAGADIPVFQLGGATPILNAGQGGPFASTAFDGNPGRIVFIPKGSFDHLAASLRVADTSRAEESAGTRIPVVPERDFRSDIIMLLDIPGNDAFRYTLRIYSLDPGSTVLVSYIDSESKVVLRRDTVSLVDPIDLYHPGYAAVTNIHPRVSIRVTIEPLTLGKRIWAFMSITNNTTQQITVVAPR